MSTAATYAALVTSAYSNTPSEAIQLTQVAKQAPTGKDLLVKLKATATNPVDFKKLRGWGKPETKVEKPFVAGFDGAGVVEAVGPEVKSFKVGDEVYFAGVLNRDGSFAEYTLVDERIVAHKPKNLTWTQAASVPLVALTTWEGITESLLLAPPANDAEKKANASKTILVIGAAGGVGSFVTQVAKHVHGFYVIATASRPDSIDFVKAHGADLVINHRKPLLDELKAHQLQGVDFVYNTSDFSEYFDQVVQVLKPLGRVVFITGPEGPVNLAPAFSKRLTITFELMFTRPLHNVEPEKQGQTLTQVAKLLDAGTLRHTVTQTFPFSHKGVSDALDLQLSGKVLGKLAISLE